MKANYNVTGNDRKALVAAIENLTGDKAIYMRMPTCAYEIGDITVDKEGGVTCEDADKLERIIHNLIADGFTPEDTEEVESDDVQAPPIGTKGTVTGVDDTGSLMVNWDNGSGLNVIYGIDRVRKVVD